VAGVDCLIFSKDRAAQLDLLLRSIERYARGFYSRIVVLWTASSVDYRWAYLNHLKMDPTFSLFVRLFEQAGPDSLFELNVRNWLGTSRSDAVSFLVDDDVFYREPGRVERLPWSPRGGDYDYPFSLDGVVYWRSDVEQLLDGLAFRDPTELEAIGHEHRDRLPFDRLHAGTPCLTGLPWNRVSTRSGMPQLGYHEFDLNERFLAGDRLALPVFDGPAGPHTLDVEPQWETARVKV
jgi:hypothetical protein